MFALSFSLLSVAIVYAGLKDKEDIFNTPSFSFLLMIISLLLVSPVLLLRLDILLVNALTTTMFAITFLYFILIEGYYIVGINDVIFILHEAIILFPISVGGYLIPSVMIHTFATVLITLFRYFKYGERIQPFLYNHMLSWFVLCPVFVFLSSFPL